MKILFPIGSFYPAQRGPANTVYWLAKALKKNKVQTIIITTDNHINDATLELDTLLENDAGSVIYTQERNYKLPIKLIFRILKEIRSVDIIHLSSLLYPPSVISVILARIYNIKVIWSVRGELEAGAIKDKSKIKNIYTNIIKLFLNENVIFHATSNEESKNIKRYFPCSKIIELPNYIELPEKLNLRVKKQILFLGRINSIKAIENLIEGASKSEVFLSSEFVIKIVGPIDNAKYLSQLKKQVSELKKKNKILFLDKVEGVAKLKLLAESYFLVLPSHSENFGNVVLEACAQGTPVIASKGTPWEKLEKNKAGYWVSNSPSELGEALDKVILLDHEDYQVMRVNAYEFVKNQYSIEDNVYKWLQLYNELNANKRSNLR